MIVIIKVILLNIFWFLCVKYGSQGKELEFFGLSLVLIVINYFTLNKSMSFLKYLGFILFFIAFGLGQDSLMYYLEIFSFKSFQSVLWLTSLWVVFLAYYGDILNKFKDFELWKLAILGAGGGMMAYYGGANLGNVTISNYYLYLSIIAISWGIFFPLTIRIFYSHYKVS